jgi:hypothetical protein
MSQHYRETNKMQVDQSSTEIFRFPSLAEMRQKKEQERARSVQQSQPVVTNYKDEDLSGCLSGNLSGSLHKSPPPTEPKRAVVINYKDDDLSGCLSGTLNPQSTQQKTTQRERFMPTQRNVRTGEITPIKQDDLSAAIDSLNEVNNLPEEEKSGWLYFN